MAAAIATWWNPPPAPLDVWAAARCAAPDGDHATRHRRGLVRLPYDLGEESGGMAGDLVEAWVCCDPACGGVELGAHVLEINHHCCVPPRFVSRRAYVPARRHMAGVGTVGFTGFHHGPFTAFWEPAGGAR